MCRCFNKTNEKKKKERQNKAKKRYDFNVIVIPLVYGTCLSSIYMHASIPVNIFIILQ